MPVLALQGTMSDDAWQDRIVGARMAVDQEFAERVEGSSFSRQQWGLVMTAVTFEIENPEDPETARLVANTDQLGAILPELDSIEQQMGGMGGPGGGGSQSSILGQISDALGLRGSSGGGVSEDQEEEARMLTQAYADQLQTFLESKGRWEEIRTAAAEE